MSFGPWFSRSVEPKQCVTNITDATNTRFGGLRNVFTELDQHSLSMDMRLNATFSPTLTLDLFAQPFLTSGRYSGTNEYAAPRTGDVLLFGRDVGTLVEERKLNGELQRYRIDPDGAGPAAEFPVDNPDFNVRSLHGTAVVRWESRQGSTLFFVWTQERSGSDSFGDFDFQRDRSVFFRDRSINVFQVKASYWLGM